MRAENDHWVCTWCGAHVEMPNEAAWRTELHAQGGMRSERVVVANREEVHRCVFPPDRTPRAVSWHRATRVEGQVHTGRPAA